jgi:hypothetical protein
MRVVRSLLIAWLMILAVLFLSEGFDVPVPLLPWRGLAARDIQMGILFVFAGVCCRPLPDHPQDATKLVEEWHRRPKRHQ